jgi:5-oxoprolinase (ATP-hydrolysing)
VEAVQTLFRPLADRPAPAEEVAEGFINIAVQQMANAIKKISVARGYDVTRYTLQCFGGAGGQHACLVADALGMTRVLVHPLAGVLSAYGMGLADQNVIREQAVERAAGGRSIARCRSGSERAGRCRPGRAAAPAGQHRHRDTQRRVHVRYEGSDSALVVPWPDAADGDAPGWPPLPKRSRPPTAALCLPDAGQGPGGGGRVGRGGGGGRRARRARHCLHVTEREVPRRETVRMYSGGPGTRPRWWCAKTCAPATWWPARPSLPRKMPPPWWSPAGPQFDGI